MQNLPKEHQQARHSVPCRWELSITQNSWEHQVLLKTLAPSRENILGFSQGVSSYCTTSVPTWPVLHALQGVAPSPIQPRLQSPCVRLPQQSVTGPQICVKWRHQRWSDAVVPAAGDPLAGPSMECLPQCPQGLFLKAYTSPPRTIPKCVSFEQAS